MEDEDLQELLGRVPSGWSKVRVDGRSYGLARSEHADGRSVSIHAEELGGTDVVSTNVWFVGQAPVLRPCEMPAEKVLAFLRRLPATPPDAADGADDADSAPVGRPLVGWKARRMPGGRELSGRACVVAPYVPEHLPALHRALDVSSPASLWTYYPGGPYADVAALGAWFAVLEQDPATRVHTILDPAGTPLGTASYLRTAPADGVVEVGNIVLGAALQRTTAATEAMYLMMRHVFDDLGYRRYEWKCDDLNAPSRRAARRLGFDYEGTFRQARVYRDRNRDTAWYAIIDSDWPAIRGELQRWLDPANHDDGGGQRTRLDVNGALGREVVVAPQDR